MRSLAERLAEIDPLNPWTAIIRGYIYMFGEGRFDLALGRDIGLLDAPDTRFDSAYALAGAKRTDEALALLERIGPKMGSEVATQLCRFLKLALQGKKEKVPELLSPDFVATTRRDFLYSLCVADLYAILDRREQALDWR